MRVTLEEWGRVDGAATDKVAGAWLLVIGDAGRVARAWTFTGDDAAGRAERDAAAYLGREWGSSEISVARLYVSDGSAWRFDSEMEF